MKGEAQISGDYDEFQMDSPFRRRHGVYRLTAGTSADQKGRSDQHQIYEVDCNTSKGVVCDRQEDVLERLKILKSW